MPISFGDARNVLQKRDIIFNTFCSQYPNMSSVRSLQAKDNTNYVIEEETDDRPRTAIVYKVVTSFMNIDLPVEAFQHWSLLFLFDDSSYIIVDANEIDGKLTPRFEHISWSKGEEMRLLPRSNIIHELKISKLQLQRFVVKNKLNYTPYDPVWNNCQDFLKSFKLWCKPPEELSSCLTAGDIGTAAVVTTAIVGGILFLASLFSKDKKKEK